MHAGYYPTTRILWVWAVFVVGLFVIPIVWFIVHYLFWTVQPIVVGIAVDLGTDTPMFYSVDTFFQTFENYLGVIALVALGVACIVYSQWKGTPAQ